MHYWNGLLCGILTSATFGTIPLFTLPLMRGGMQLPTILFYRFALSALLLGVAVAFTRKTFRISGKECGTLGYLSLLYIGSALFLFWSYDYLASGIATTIIFLYPVFVAVLMAVFFKEKLSVFVYVAIAMSLVGVAFLSGAGSAGGIQATGVVLGVLSALSYGVYIIGVNKSCVQNMCAWKLTFYVFLFSAVLFGLAALCKGGIQPAHGWNAHFHLLMLALVPTVISNLSLVYAIKNIGSTLSAVLGACEPLTAMIIGVSVFKEPFTHSVACGLVLIITAVTLIILSPMLTKGYRKGKFLYITKVRKIHPHIVPYH